MRVAFSLDPASDAPLHRQVYEEWRQGILSGRFRPGARVPSTRELAAMLSVARTTVTAAYDQLVAEGYLESVRGSGTFVCRELPDALRHPRRTPVPRSAAEVPLRLSRYGGDCYAYCMLAAGHVDLVIETELKPYDVLPLVPIIAGAGGVITTWEGGAPHQRARIVAAGDKRVHAAALAMLAGR